MTQSPVDPPPPLADSATIAAYDRGFAEGFDIGYQEGYDDGSADVHAAHEKENP